MKAAALVLLLVLPALVLGDSSWKVMQKTLGVECTGIASPEHNIVMVAGADDVVGPTIYKTENDGQTWFPTKVPVLDVIMMLSVAAHSNISAIGIGAMGDVYTKDGYDFHGADCARFSTAQDGVEYGVNGRDYLIPGSFTTENFAEINGICISNDGGVHFVCRNINVWKNRKDEGYATRYADCPSQQVMYATAGSWPDQNTRQISRFVEMSHDVRHKRHLPAAGNITQFYGAIAKSVDGGKTWTEVYNEWTHTMYFNQISCATVNMCIAVAEGDAGAAVFRTIDGGQSWDVPFTVSSASLIAAYMHSTKDMWVAGGGQSSLGEDEGYFFHSVDGGNTWTKEYTHWNYIMFMDFVDWDHGYAATVTQFQTCEILRYSPD